MTSQSLTTVFGGDDQSFANQVFRNYSQQLLQLANEHLDSRLNGKVSAEDVVQSALKSFFRRVELLGLSKANQDIIWGLLAIITVRKCRRWQAFYRCGKRDVQRESVSTNDSTFERIQGDAASAPNVEDAIIATELIEQLLRNFTERQQKMILLRIQGVSNKQIAVECQSSVRTVARTITRAKSILAGLVLED